MTEEGNPRLLLGGKQADDLGNFCAVYNWACLLLFQSLALRSVEIGLVQDWGAVPGVGV